MSEAEIYYREVNCLTVEEHPLLGKKHHEIIEHMEDFAKHSASKEAVKMSFKDAPVGARFVYPNMGSDDIWVKIDSYPKSHLNDGNGLIAKWNGNTEERQSHCSFVDEESKITFDTIIELI